MMIYKEIKRQDGAFAMTGSSQLEKKLDQPLAVVVGMVSIGVAIAIGSVAQSVVTGVAQSVGTIGVPGVGLSLGLRLSLGRPLAVVETMVGIGVAIAIGSVAQSVVTQSVSVGTIGVPGVSLSLGLRLSLSRPGTNVSFK